MRTCCGIVRDTSSRVMATIRERFRITSGIGISAIRFDIRNCRRQGSRTFGGIRRPSASLADMNVRLEGYVRRGHHHLRCQARAVATDAVTLPENVAECFALCGGALSPL